MTAHAPSHGRYCHGCRCDGCREAHRVFKFAHRQSLKARLDDAPHGTPGGYSNWGCRCVACTEAKQADNARTSARRRQARGLPPTPWQAQFVT